MADLPLHDYEALVQRITNSAAADFRRAIRDRSALRSACCRYFKIGREANLTTGELLDLLAVSSPSALEIAGYSDEQVQSVMELVAQITEEEIAATRL